MRWVVVFLPRCITLFMNLASSKLLYLASGGICRRSARLLLDIGITLSQSPTGKPRGLKLAETDLAEGRARLGSPVLAAPAAPVLYSLAIEDAADYMVADTRQILHAATPH